MRALAIFVLCRCTAALVVPLSAGRPAASLSGITLPRDVDSEKVDIGAALLATNGKTMLVLGSHAADFNTVEYLQKLRYFLPALQEKGIDRCMMVINGKASACGFLREALDLPKEVELFADPTGEAGRAYGVSRGFMPDNASLSPFIKLFVVGIGLGPPWGTLGAVGTGYLGNPNGRREWIEATLKQGQEAGRWPDNVLELADDGAIVGNKFDTFPLLSSWGRRPFELATMRLQNLVSLQMKNWEALKPTDDRCLTQLGGCTVVGPGGEALFSWVDQGLCDIPDMYELIDEI